MKKILSLTLAALLLVSMIPTAMAADQDYSLGTQITVVGGGGEYSVTVPATLEPGQTGTVTAKGYWSKDQKLTVTAPETIEVTHTETSQKATVNVDFNGIESLGDDLEEMTKAADISIDAGNTKFGTWTGTIVYNVVLADVMPAGEIINFKVGATSHTAESGMTWADWINSDDNTINCSAVDGAVQAANGMYVLSIDGNTLVNPSDEIIANQNYVWKEK